MFANKTSGLYYKSFMIIIYNRNDNGRYYKTTILANLALAESVNYGCKVRRKLKRTFMIVNYDPKHFKYLKVPFRCPTLG